MNKEELEEYEYRQYVDGDFSVKNFIRILLATEKEKALTQYKEELRGRIKRVLETFVWDCELGNGDHIIEIGENRRNLNEKVLELILLKDQ